MVTNVGNIKQYRTKLPHSVFFVDLKAAPNNKDIKNVEFIQQCKIKFEPPKHKRDIDQCVNCKRHEHNKNYCHLKPRCVKCADDHLTNQCHHKERSSDVPCVLCGGNYHTNYKRCTIYKELQKKAYPPL
jgi:PAX-interacting protein 1